MKLYEITNEIAALNSIESDDEGMAQAISDTLDGISGELESKAQAVVLFIKNIESDAESISAEIERLQSRKKAIINKSESVREYLRFNMEKAGIQKIECPLFTIRCQKGREIAVIENQESLPDEFVTVKTEIKPDKNAIAKALKEGIDVPGARLELSKSSIVIK